MKKLYIAMLFMSVSSAVTAGPHPASIIYDGGAFDSTQKIIQEASSGNLINAFGTLITDYPNFSQPEAVVRDDAWRVFRSFTTRRR